MIKKLPYYKQWDVTPITVYLTEQGKGGKKETEETWTGLCNFSETHKRVQNSQGIWVHLSGVVHIKGDIFPDKDHIEGYVIINGQKLNIDYSSRPRNPDGTINHTRLELI